jgi:signal peptidase II
MTCLILVASLVVIVDRLSKYLVFNNLFEGQSIALVPKMLHLTLVLNTGAAFGLLRDRNYFFVASSFIVIALILGYVLLGKARDPVVLSALALILGGAVGNLADRMIFGYIIDFIDLRIWPVFNIADSAITIGSALLIMRLFFGKRCCTQ